MTLNVADAAGKGYGVWSPIHPVKEPVAVNETETVMVHDWPCGKIWFSTQLVAAGLVVKPDPVLFPVVPNVYHTACGPPVLVTVNVVDVGVPLVTVPKSWEVGETVSATCGGALGKQAAASMPTPMHAAPKTARRLTR